MRFRDDDSRRIDDWGPPPLWATERGIREARETAALLSAMRYDLIQTDESFSDTEKMLISLHHRLEAGTAP